MLFNVENIFFQMIRKARSKKNKSSIDPKCLNTKTEIIIYSKLSTADGKGKILTSFQF